LSGAYSATEFPFASGGRIDFARPDLSSVTIEDIAFGLAAASRFGGQCVSRATGRRVRYTVAEHCVRGSRMAPRGLEYPFLMHETGEGAGCGDMISPLKSLCLEYGRIEKGIGELGFAKWEVPPFDRASLKIIDRRMLATEKRDLTPYSVEDWHYTAGAQPFADLNLSYPWGFEEAAFEFLKRFGELAPAHVADAEGIWRL
jgi:hypothetical protein